MNTADFTKHQTIYKKLDNILNLQELLTHKAGYNFKLKSSGFMDLSVEILERNKEFIRISLTHYGEQNGDLMADPDISNESAEAKVNRIAEYFKGYTLKQITSQTVEEFKKWRKNTVIVKGGHKGELTKGTTVNRDLALLKKMFSIAVQNKWMDENPALNCKVKMFTEDNEIVRYLTDAEEKRLLEACKGDYAYLKPMIITAINTGMRYGELVKLRWKENIDFKSGFIILTADMTKAKKKRMIPISSVLLREFEELYNNRLSDYVFTNPKTLRPYHTIRKSFQKVKMIAEIDPEFRWHDLRHHMATKLMDKNINVGVIKDILGHSTLAITQKYAHAKDTTKKMAVELLAINLC